MSVIDMNTPFVVDANTREIINKEHKKKVLIQGDHNSERFTFEIPRFIEGRDIGKCNSVQIHYINVGKGGKQSTGVYTVTDLNVYEFIHDMLSCSWLISQNATKHEGTLSFMIRFAEIVNETEIKYAWHTDTYDDIRIAKSIDADEEFEEEYIDIIAQWKHDVMNELYEYVNSTVETSVDEHTRDLVTRLDNLAKVEGEGLTDAEKELVDIRVGADGETYDNAGQAVREQFKNVLAEVDDVYYLNGITPNNSHYLDHYGIGSDGEVVMNDYTSYSHTTCTIPVRENTRVDVIAKYIARIALYDENDKVVPDSVTQEVLSGEIGMLVKQNGYLRYTIVALDDSYNYYTPKDSVVVRVTPLFDNMVAPKNFGSKYLYAPSFRVGLMANYVVDGAGNVMNNGSYAITDYIPVDPYETLSAYYAAPSLGAVYDKDKKWVASIKGNTGVIGPMTFTVPKGAAFIRFNIRKVDAAKYSVVYGTTPVETPDAALVSPYFFAVSDEERSSIVAEAAEQSVARMASEWEGSTFCSLGDSITWQDGKAYSQGDIGAIARGYQTIVKETLGFASYDNFGVSGAPVANGSRNGDGTVTTALSKTYSKYGLCIIAGGTNDFKLDVPLGELGAIGDTDFDDTTFYGAYRKMVEYILKQKPTIRICLFTPIQRDASNYDVNYTNAAGHKLIDYVNAIRKIGEMYSLPVCDMYANSGITKLTLVTYTMDGLHPNDAGYSRMGNYAAKFIDNIGR